MTHTSNTVPPETLSFENALQELDTIVRSLEQGTVDLDKAIDFYERGNALKRHCENKLREAKLRIDQIERTAHGEVHIGPSPLQNQESLVPSC